MAIQFDCPYCTATMRVPDAAAGRLGDCPRCQTRLRIPIVPVPAPADAGRPPVGATASPGRIVATAGGDNELPFAGITFEAPLVGASVPGASALRVATPGTADPSLIYSRRRRSAQRTKLWTAAAFILGGIAVAAAIGWQLLQRDRFSGELTAAVATQASVSTVVSKSVYQIPDADWAAIRLALEQTPAELRSRQMTIRLESAPRGMRVSLAPGGGFELIVVDLPKLAAFAEFAKQSAAKREGPRRQRLESELARLAEAIKSATAAGRRFDAAEFGVSVGVQSLAGGLAAHLHAVIDRSAFLCVYEDRRQQVYFLLPAGTESFQIRERLTDDQPQVFPAQVRVDVRIERASVAPSESQGAGDSQEDAATDATDAEASAAPDPEDSAAADAPEDENADPPPAAEMENSR